MFLIILFILIVSQSQTCYDLQSTDPNVCGGNGRCASNDTCMCFWPYDGKQCQSIITCGREPADSPFVCESHGMCVARDKCLCYSPFYGELCTLYDLRPTASGKNLKYMNVK